MKKTQTALGAMIALSLSATPVVSKAADLFQTESLTQGGYAIVYGDEKKDTESKCGEGKCGEGKCGGEKKDTEEKK